MNKHNALGISFIQVNSLIYNFKIYTFCVKNTQLFKQKIKAQKFYILLGYKWLFGNVKMKFLNQYTFVEDCENSGGICAWGI